jgi:small subunit ribosomal protein S9
MAKTKENTTKTEQKKPEAETKAPAKEKKETTSAKPKVKASAKTPAKTKASPTKESGLKVPKESFYATGRRKSSVARVWIFPGTGQVEINGVSPKDHLKREVLIEAILRPFSKLSLSGKYDVKATVLGGGLTGQAGALQLGIARAVLLTNAEFKPSLKETKLLTRDMRIKERKKYGRKKARKGRTYRKR